MSAQEREWQPGDKALVEVEVTWTDDEGTVQCSIGADDGYFLPTNVLRPVPAGGEVEAAVFEAIEDDGNDPERPTHPERIAGWRACADAVREALDAARGGEVEAATEDALARAVMGALQCDVIPVCREDCGMDCDGDHEERECYEHEDPERIPFTGDVCWLAQSVVDAIRPLLAGGVPGRSEAEALTETEWNAAGVDGDPLIQHASDEDAARDLVARVPGTHVVRREVTRWRHEYADEVAGRVAGTEAGDDRG